MEQDGDLNLPFWCYHGTLMESAEKIREQKKFVCERKSTHWLGNGIYFFVDDSSKAKWWAQEHAKNIYKKDGLEKPTAYIRVKVDTLKRDLLNLDTEDDRQILDKHAKDFRRKISSISFRGRSTDLTSQEIRTMIFEYIIQSKGYKAIKYTFSNTKLSYENFNQGFSLKNEQYLKNNGTQLVVLDQSLINFETLMIYELK